MIYNDFHGLKLSSLGLGCMRLPTMGEDDQIDMEQLKCVHGSLKFGMSQTFDTSLMEA